jgi:hypothetical protein
MRRSPRILILFGVVIVLALILVSAAGGIGKLLSYNCRRDAEALGLNWVWTQTHGCLVQQPNGNWLPLDSHRYPQVP